MLKKPQQNSQKQPLRSQKQQRRKQQLVNQNQRQKLKRAKQNDSYLKKLHDLKLNAVKKKLGVGTGKAFWNVCVVIFKIFCYTTIIGGGIAVAAWFLILKPIFGLLNPLNLVKKLNPVKLFKK
jgi:hypothetical protein